MRLPPGLFYGTSLRSAVVGGFKLSETVYSGDLKTPEHSHEFAYLGMVLEGQSSQTVGHNSHLCRRGTVTFHPPGETHSDHFYSPNVRLLQIEILPRRLAEMSEHLAVLTPRWTDSQTGRQSWLADRLRMELHQTDDVSPLAVEGFALELVTEVWRNPTRQFTSRPPAWLKKADELIHDRFAEHFALSAIADEVGVHSSHLSREFRRFYRKTIGERIRELRIEYACRELRLSERPLAEIATDAGFCDQAHFSRAFRRLMGVPPDRFRSSAKNPQV